MQIFGDGLNNRECGDHPALPEIRLSETRFVAWTNTALESPVIVAHVDIVRRTGVVVLIRS